MEFWRVKIVADQLINHEVTKNETIVSIIVVILLMFGKFIVTFEGSLFTTKNLLILAIVVTMWGLPSLLLFLVDYYRKGKNFFERYVHLARPLLVNFQVSNAVGIIGIGLATDVILRLFFNYSEDVRYQIFVLMTTPIFPLFYIIFFWRLNKWLKYTAQRAQGE